MTPDKSKVLLVASLFLGLFGTAWASPVSFAESQIGKGETTGDNRGAYIRKIGKEGQPWCAYFVSYCLNLKKPIPNARGFLKAYSRVLQPRRGDIVVWSRGRDGRSGHVGLIKAVYKGYFEAIEGNTGAFPSKVRVVRHKLNDKAILGFVRPKKEV